jgi:hypothetical protein
MSLFVISPTITIFIFETFTLSVTSNSFLPESF